MGYRVLVATERNWDRRRLIVQSGWMSNIEDTTIALRVVKRIGCSLETDDGKK